VIGAVSLLAVEQRLPTAIAHGGRRVARLALYAAVTVTVATALAIAGTTALVISAL
jgi:hypothetical protein